MNASRERWTAPRPGAAEVAALAARSAQLLNPNSLSPLLLVCEHAGSAVPDPWRSLGVADFILASHFGCDIGAEALVRAIARKFRLPVVLARYSRLFLDYNRFPREWDCMRPDVGGIPIPGNLDIGPEERELREAIARRRLDAVIENGLDSRRAMISVHTFTPVFNGTRRPWEVGVLWRDDERFARILLRSLYGRLPDISVGDNQPYDLRGIDAFTLNRHAVSRDLPCLAVEIRNDVLDDPFQLDHMAAALGSAITEATTEFLALVGQP